MSETTTATNAPLLDALKAADGNAVAYSHAAWAVVRKTSGGGDRWFPDRASNVALSLTSAELMDWVTDWDILRTGDSLAETF